MAARKRIAHKRNRTETSTTVCLVGRRELIRSKTKLKSPRVDFRISSVRASPRNVLNVQVAYFKGNHFSKALPDFRVARPLLRNAISYRIHDNDVQVAFDGLI